MGQKEHKIYVNGELEEEFESAALYDTLSPYRWVANSFYKLNQQLKAGETIKIISNGFDHPIRSELDFENWIKRFFNSPSNGGFEEYLNKEIE